MKFMYRYTRVRVWLYRKFFSNIRKLKFTGKILQATQFIGTGEIFAQNVELGVFPSPYFTNGVGYIEARNTTAKIEILDNTFINNNFVMIADRTKITIGRRCLIGTNFFVTDSDFHGLAINNRTNGNYECLPVEIGDDVFIGSDVKILKGVKIGQGAVIANVAIVVKDVPPLTIFAGIPAKFVKNIPVD